MRKDIQALRAIAVLAVVLFHFWPNRLPGGYVGVDIFFVISGFLITSHLLKKPPLTWSKLTDFWARRIRRLLPAATFVLLTTIVAGLVWLPETMIPRMLHEAMAAALYGENWMLAASATDYLAAEEAKSPIQHYWSLSVEEQYYAIWPLIIAVAFLIGTKLKSLKKSLVFMMAVTFSLSLAYSIYLTSVDPAAAYFVTPTRIWELTLGGIVGLGVYYGLELKPRISAALAWVGLFIIAASFVIFTEETPFPSYTALLPVLGTGMILLASVDSIPYSPRRLFGMRINQFIGDISYSIYLWHWPIVIIAPYALGSNLVAWEKITLILLSILLADLTKRYIEDPVRVSKKLNVNKLRSFKYGFASIAVVLFASIGTLGWINSIQSADTVALQKALSSGDRCIGAGSIRNDCNPIAGKKLLTTPIVAKEDLYKSLDMACTSNINTSLDLRVKCSLGNTKNPKHKVALFGNSHASMWYPALKKIVSRGDWQLDVYVMRWCNVGYVIADSNTLASRDKKCSQWNEWAINSIAAKDYDSVIMTTKTTPSRLATNQEDKGRILQQAYGNTIDRLLDEDKRIIVIRDVPTFKTSIPDCIGLNENDISKCNAPRHEVLKTDRLYEAAKDSKANKVQTIDLTNRFCDEKTCYAVLGGVIVYRDANHITDTFSETLYEDIRVPIEKILD